MMYYSVKETGILRKMEIGVLVSGVEPKTVQIASLDALPLSYRDSWELTCNILLGLECNKCDGISKCSWISIFLSMPSFFE